MDYIIRSATPDDHDLIYLLKSQSVRPYVEKIWGWDESYQQNDFDRDFSQIGQFVETDTRYIMEYDKGLVGVNRDVTQMNRRLNDGMKRGK